MTDAARQDMPQPDEARHTLTVREVEAMLAQAGVQRSHRHVLRLCQSGMLDAVKIPGGPSGEEWYVAPASVPKAIGDLKQIDAQKARRAAPQHVTSGHDVPSPAPKNDPDASRYVAPQQATSVAGNNNEHTPTQPDIARHVVPDLDIYQHPYVKKLEDRIEKLENKYEAQVRRTEDIQIKSQEKLLELQRMTAVGQSQTLAEFMLKARNWVLGTSIDNEAAKETEQGGA